MAPNHSGDAPIYDSLVGEQGDVLAEARQAAEEAQRTTGDAAPIDELARRKPEPGFFDGRPAPIAPEQGAAPETPGLPVPQQPEQPQQPGDQLPSAGYEAPGPWSDELLPGPGPQPASSSMSGFEQPSGDWSPAHEPGDSVGRSA